MRDPFDGQFQGLLKPVPVLFKSSPVGDVAADSEDPGGFSVPVAVHALGGLENAVTTARVQGLFAGDGLSRGEDLAILRNKRGSLFRSEEVGVEVADERVGGTAEVGGGRGVGQEIAAFSIFHVDGVGGRFQGCLEECFGAEGCGSHQCSYFEVCSPVQSGKRTPAISNSPQRSARETTRSPAAVSPW